MSNMWSKAFWKAAAERAVRAAAAAMLSVLVVGDAMLNALNVNWQETAGIGLGGALVSVLLSLAGGAVSGNGPAFTTVESVKRV